ncbi:response regulator [Luteimonas sp. MC1750]|uniref:response regulator n=1 Tax=Luteimonas sp. MC1750 TaxID=2799326 RepID=UPI0018F0CB7A|nr:response regulator [Luteimonas sp. MC1750]MBJ6983736.1 response regulator [Luteimonas sp. MC1750]QQO06571.1 response regulator [Luteimonas sp. MC1750]
MSAGKRLLLVEDERSLLMLVGDALEDTGFDVVPAHDGVQAMARLQDEGGFDYVVSDISMPGGISGFDIAEHVLASESQARIVLVSGLARGQLPPLPAGVTFLPKPYRISQLLDVLG